jgi:hypothetical protein
MLTTPRAPNVSKLRHFILDTNATHMNDIIGDFLVIYNLPKLYMKIVFL